ncbi:MAG: hypothetical protein AAF402_03865 [Pseudomonadota bacterium]
MEAETLSEKQFMGFARGGVVKTINGGGISVIRTRDGNYLKFFRPRSLLSSDWLSPRPTRFMRAARGLRELGIPTVHDPRLFWVPAMKKHVVHYRPLEGRTLRKIMKKNPRNDLVKNFAGFVASLHQKGVYFRGLNFKNTILTPDGHLGLIDIGSVEIKTGSLGSARCARNMKHPLAYGLEQSVLERYGMEIFIRDYLDKAPLDSESRHRFLIDLKKQHRLFEQIEVF